MKIRYECVYRCREHGIFRRKGMLDIHETVECPSKGCHRLSELVEGTFIRVADNKRTVSKNQKKLEVN